MKRKYLSYEETKELLPIDDLKSKLQNQTYKEIANEYNMDERIVSQLTQKEYGIPKNYNVIRKNRIIDFNEPELIDLYINQKKSLREIAKHYNTTHSTIKKKIESMNIEIRPFNYLSYYDNRRKNNILKYIDNNGYYVLMINGKFIREHRYVMELYLNRSLENDEIVHHIDFNKQNNNINNLYLFEKQQYHALYHCYIQDNDYIPPEQFILENKKLIDSILNYNFLYDMYINNKYSINAISYYICNELKINISRSTITKILKQNGIYDLLQPVVNQNDNRICVSDL